MAACPADATATHIAIVACGTRGDVEPALNVALELCRPPTAEEPTPPGRSLAQVRFCTHASFKGLVERRIKACAAAHSSQAIATFVPLPSLPARQWLAAASSPDTGGEDVDDSTHISGGDNNYLGTGLSAVHLRAVRVACDGCRLIVFNLFALEAFHVAESQGVLSAALSPYLIPYAVPANFEGRFRRALPDLYSLLKGTDAEASDKASWRDVDHWMWALFSLKRWGAWRRRDLHTTPLPWMRCTPSLPPRATPLLYGFSETVVPRPGYWPRSVHACGFWRYTTPTVAAAATVAHRPKRQRTAGPAAAVPPVVICFGSMPRMGLLQRPVSCLRVLAHALQAVGRRAIVVAGDADELYDAWRAAAEQDLPRAWAAGDTEPDPMRRPWLVPGSSLHDWQPWTNWLRWCGAGDDGDSADEVDGADEVARWIWCYPGSVPFGWLLPQVGLVIHHGGSGTVSECMHAAVPQVVVPFIYDQPFWADKVSWLGLGPDPVPRETIMPVLCSLDVMVSKPGETRPQRLGRFRKHWRSGYSADGLHELHNSGVRVRDALAFALRPIVAEACARLKRALMDESGARGAAQLVGRLALSRGSMAPSVQAGAPPALPQVARWQRISATPSRHAVWSATLRNGLEIQCNSRAEGEFIADEVFGDDVYLRHGIQIRPGYTVVDVGANVGMFTLRACLACKRAGDRTGSTAVTRVFAFEPARQSFELLARNVAQNATLVREAHCAVHLMRLGAHSTPGRMQLTYYEQMPGNSTLKPFEKLTQRKAMDPTKVQSLFRGTLEPVRLVRLSDVFHRYDLVPARARVSSDTGRTAPTAAAATAAHRDNTTTDSTCQPSRRVDLLKIDVEGSELEVLQSIDDADWPFIQQVSLEAHAVGDRLGRICALLRLWGFRVVAEQPKFCQRVGLNNWQVYATRAPAPSQLA